MYYDIVIIGGGAAGMCTAIQSKKTEHSVLLIEHNDRLGKKILSTGNGKCNLTNRFCKVSLFEDNPEGLYPYYPEQNRTFIESVINRFDCDHTISWFQDLGILCENKNGYIYPLSEQASSVLDMLRYAVKISGTEVLLNYQPVKVKKKGSFFEIDDEIRCKKLVLCCGGMAAPNTGSDGSGYVLAAAFGHRIIKPLPALCGLKCKGDAFKKMQGVRAECRLRIFTESPKQSALTAFGNVQFNSYGISGIPAMQVSSYVGRKLKEAGKNKKNVSSDWNVNIEFLPYLSFEEVVDFIDRKLKTVSRKDRELLPLSWVLEGILNKKVIAVIFEEAGLRADRNLEESLRRFYESEQFTAAKTCAKHLDHPDKEQIFAARIAGLLKHFAAEITDTCGFEEAQITSGGVCADEIDPDTMESRLIPGLYFAGEIVDVDGICGGYNLQWAWSTAMTAAQNCTIGFKGKGQQ